MFINLIKKIPFIFTCTVLVLFFFTSCKTVTPENQDASNLHLQIALGHIQNQNYPQALRELQIAEQLNPNHPYVQSNLGLVYILRDRNDLAEKFLKKSIQLKPDFTEAKNNLAHAYIELGRNSEAEALLKDVVSDFTFVDYPTAYINYANLEFNRQKYTEAIIYAKKAIEGNNSNCFAWLYLGRSYLELNQYTAALAALEKASGLCLAVGTDSAHYYTAIALYRNKHKDLAKKKFQELIRLFPNGKNFEKSQQMLNVINKGIL